MLSLDLSAAFDLVDRALLIKRMSIMGIHESTTNLVNAWLTDRSAYTEVDGICSQHFPIPYGTVQGSVLGPILFAIFISPAFDLFDENTLNSFADDSYMVQTGKSENVVIAELLANSSKLFDWLEMSGMKVNAEKTELCIFSKKEIITKSVTFKSNCIEVLKSIKVLGLIFDSKLKWNTHVIKTLTSCSKLLFALHILKQSLNTKQMIDVTTSIVFSKLYYGAVVWLHGGLSVALKRKIYSMSAKCLRTCLGYKTSDRVSFDAIHREANRATPRMMQNFVHACYMYKIFHGLKPDVIYNKLLLTFMNENRSANPKFTSNQKSRVGINSFHNRLQEVSHALRFDWINISYPAFKVLVKKQFLSYE